MSEGEKAYRVISGIAEAIVAQTIMRLWRAAGAAAGVDTPVRLMHPKSQDLDRMQSFDHTEYFQKFFRTFFEEAVTTPGAGPIGRVSLVAARTPERTATRPTHFSGAWER